MFRSSRHLFSATIFLLLTVALEAQSVQVTFQVKAPPGTDRVTIAGNHPLLGQWDPTATSLTFKDSLFSLTLRFPAPTTIEYKFTRGTWNTEALNPDTTIPPNYRVSLTADTTLYHRILFWKDQTPIPLSGVTGKVNIHPHFFSPELGNERTLLVWLPPSYAATNRRYPVLYIQDGQNVFNPATSFAGHDWRLDETATRLIQEGLIREIIMVGIYNTP